MPSIRFNGPIFITVVISSMAVLLAGLVFFLLPGPDEIIRRMQARMIEAESFSFTLEVSYEGTREYRDGEYVLRSDEEQFIVRSKGQMDRRDAQDVRLRQEFSIAVGGAAQPVASGEARSVGGRDFIRFAALPDRLGALQTAPLRGSWLRYDLDRLRESIDAPLVGSTGHAITPDEQQELLRRVAKSAFVRFQRNLEDDAAASVPTVHYETMPEPLFFKDFFVREEAIRLGRPLTDKETRAVDVAFGSVTPLPSEVWIGARDRYLYKAILRFSIDDDGRKGTVQVTATFADFGKVLDVASPEGKVTDIDAFLAIVLPGIAAHLPLAQDGAVRTMPAPEEEARIGLPIGGSDSATIDTDEDGLTDAMELFFGSNPLVADTDGDGVTDGDEVEVGRNPAGPGMLFDFGVLNRDL